MKRKAYLVILLCVLSSMVMVGCSNDSNSGGTSTNAPAMTNK